MKEMGVYRRKDTISGVNIDMINWENIFATCIIGTSLYKCVEKGLRAACWTHNMIISEIRSGEGPGGERDLHLYFHFDCLNLLQYKSTYELFV